VNGYPMTEYMSVKETAVAWGISERRVHKLCEDGKIAGIARLGRAWGIPAQTPKPPDGRRCRVGLSDTNNTEISIFDNFRVPDATLLFRKESCLVYRLENAADTGIVTIYDVFPGVVLCYNDLHLRKINGRDNPNAPLGADMLVVNHCREGRLEVEFRGGERGYLGAGDWVVSNMPAPLKSLSFPLSHYHGISIQIDISQAAKTIEDVCKALRISQIDLRQIKANLPGKHPYFLTGGTSAVARIFAEFYNAPPESKENHIRLKLVELLLFLSAAEPEPPSEQRYFRKIYVEAVKALRDYITENSDSQFTLPELSKRFDIPLTAMKSCFKAIFGMPICKYLREYRLHAAAAMLRETDEPIAEIAARVGYDSHTKFTAAFRAYFHATPLEFRKTAVRLE
jgi:AraC-like DNA-binding protein